METDSPPLTSDSPSDADPASLAGRLPTMTRAEFLVRRPFFDARFTRWALEVFGRPHIQVRTQPMVADTVIELCCDLGRLTLGIDSLRWPSMHMALALDADDDLRHQVATCLLSSHLEAMPPVLQESRVVSHRLLERVTCERVVLRDQEFEVALIGLDTALGDALLEVLASVGSNLESFLSIKVRGRLRAGMRRMDAKTIRSLTAGDVVLLEKEAGMRRFEIAFGLGRPMKIIAAAYMNESEMSVTEEPFYAESDSEDEDEPEDSLPEESSINDLQLPVAFEVDTARISLGELASMQPGSTVELGAPLQSAMVRMVCHGRTIGTGQLIAVGEQLAVRIVRMGDRHGDDAQR